MFPILTAVAIITCFVLVLYATSIMLRDNSIMDVAYAIIFMTIGAVLYSIGMSESLAEKMLMLLLFAWGIRLSLRIYLRRAGNAEDFRYKAWRDEWLKKGSAYFYFRSLFQVFVLQGVIIFVVALPLILGLSSTFEPIKEWFIVGVLLFGIGYFFEVLADFQLDAFAKDKNNKGKIMTSGLFRYSRRPNYFGESMIWWGMACLSASMLSGVWFYLVFLSPITITYILLFVTGPMLERKFMSNADYREYADITSYFVPLPPRGK